MGCYKRLLQRWIRASWQIVLKLGVPFLKKGLVEKIIKIGISVHSPLEKRKKFL